MSARYHKKRDGIFMVRPDGSGRFLTLLERIACQIFGREPRDSCSGDGKEGCP